MADIHRTRMKDPNAKSLAIRQNVPCDLYCIQTKNLSCLKSGVEFDMNDIFYEFKYLHHFYDSLMFGVNAL